MRSISVVGCLMIVASVFIGCSDEECPQGYAFQDGTCTALVCISDPESCELKPADAQVEQDSEVDAAMIEDVGTGPVKNCTPKQGPNADESDICPESKVCHGEKGICIFEKGTASSKGLCESCLADSQCKSGVCVRRHPDDAASADEGAFCVGVASPTKGCTGRKYNSLAGATSESGFTGAACFPPPGISCEQAKAFGKTCNPNKPSKACGEQICYAEEKKCTYYCSEPGAHKDCLANTFCVVIDPNEPNLAACVTL